LPENITIGSGETGSLESMLEKLYPMLNLVELDAILLDNFKNHDFDFNSFYARAFGESALPFADGMQEACFFNELESRFEEMLDHYPRELDSATGEIRNMIVEFTMDTLHRQGSTNMAVAGHVRLLDQPEYRSIDKAQKVLSSLDEDTLSGLPAVMQNANGTKVLVGPENVAEELKDTSVVMTKFDIGDGLQGMIGVVGPTRMDYAKVTARLSYFAESLSKMFNKPEQPQLPETTEE
jgi:heat-inducible transcriptional repressor